MYWHPIDERPRLLAEIIAINPPVAAAPVTVKITSILIVDATPGATIRRDKPLLVANEHSLDVHRG